MQRTIWASSAMTFPTQISGVDFHSSTSNRFIHSLYLVKSFYAKKYHLKINPIIKKTPDSFKIFYKRYLIIIAMVSTISSGPMIL